MCDSTKRQDVRFSRIWDHACADADTNGRYRTNTPLPFNTDFHCTAMLNKTYTSSTKRNMWTEEVGQDMLMYWRLFDTYDAHRRRQAGQTKNMEKKTF